MPLANRSTMMVRAHETNMVARALVERLSICVLVRTRGLICNMKFFLKKLEDKGGRPWAPKGEIQYK